MAEEPRALSRAAALLLSLLLFKVYLLAWYRLTQSVDPLAMLSWRQALSVPAMDVAFGGLIAIAYLLLVRLAALSRGGAAPWLLGGAMLATHLGVVSFSLVSLKLNQIYGRPLTIGHLRAASDLVALRDSVLGYVDVAVVLLFILALSFYWIVPWLLTRLVPGRRELPRHVAWISLVLVVLGCAGASYTQLRYVYTSGLKRNALAYFVRTYTPPLSDAAVPRTLEELETRLGEDAAELWRAPSLWVQAPEAPDELASFAGRGRGFSLVLIVLESTSSLHIDPTTAPNIAKLAASGISFDRYFTSASSSLEAGYSLLYSDYLPLLDARLRQIYAGRAPHAPLPEIFQGAGYATASFNSAHLSYSDFRFLNERGVDSIVGPTELRSRGASSGWALGAYEHQTVDALEVWVLEHRHERFLAAYFPVFPHHPYFSPVHPPPFEITGEKSKHRSAVHYVDGQIGRIVELLEREGMLEDTILAIVADHGETISDVRSGHGMEHSLEELRVPFILWNPHVFPVPATISQTANHLDLAPTLAGLVGLAPAPEWRGRNLLANATPTRILHLVENYSGWVGLIDGDLVFSMSTDTGAHRLREIVGSRAERLLPDDPRRELASRYREMAESFRHWAVWEHLRKGRLARLDAERLRPDSSKEGPSASEEGRLE